MPPPTSGALVRVERPGQLLVDLHADSSSRPRDQIDSPGLQTGPYVESQSELREAIRGQTKEPGGSPPRCAVLSPDFGPV